MQELLHMNNAVGWDKIMNNDLTVGKSEKVLWRFCLPLFGSIIFQQLYNIADSLVAGKFIGENALAAVGNSYEITLIFIAFAFGCNIGGSVVVAQFFGAKPVTYGLREENNYQIDPAEIARLITPQTKMLILNTPGNPTGTVQTRETLEALAALAEKNDLIVVSDEIYEKLVYGGAEHVSFASLPGMRERTITLNGFSKCYSMTGWRLGYAAAPKEFIQAMVRVHQYINTCAPSFVQEAGITALEQGEAEIERMRLEYERRRDYAVRAINAIDGLSCVVPNGAFYIFVNIRRLGMTSREAADYLLDTAHVATVPGSAFGANGEGYLRLSYACAFDRIVEAMARIEKALAARG